MHFRIRPKRKRKKITIKKIIIFFVVIILLISIGYAAYTQDLTISGGATVSEDDSSKVLVEVKLKNSWGSDGDYTYQYTISITNNSSKEINGWKIGFTVPLGTTAIQESNATVTITDTSLICSSPNKISIGGKATAEIAINTSVANFEYTDLTFNGNSTGDGGTTTEPTGITLNTSSATLDIGGTKDLIATITPTGATGVIEWTSSNTDVATISNTGRVTAIAVGATTITATLNSLTATCSITVTENQASTDNIAITITKAGGWGNTIQFNVDIKNISTTTINFWEFQAELPEGTTIGGNWNCTITSGENNIYTFSNGTSAAYLAAGDTHSFGVQIDSPVSDYTITPINIVTSQ